MALTVDGAKVRRLREEAGLTREDFIMRARELGLDLTGATLARVESGIGGHRVETLGQIAHVLGVRPALLLTVKDDAA